jgi:hypothetical protein
MQIVEFRIMTDLCMNRELAHSDLPPFPGVFSDIAMRLNTRWQTGTFSSEKSKKRHSTLILSISYCSRNFQKMLDNEAGLDTRVFTFR